MASRCLRLRVEGAGAVAVRLWRLCGAVVLAPVVRSFPRGRCDGRNAWGLNEQSVHEASTALAVRDAADERSSAAVQDGDIRCLERSATFVDSTSGQGYIFVVRARNCWILLKEVIFMHFFL